MLTLARQQQSGSIDDHQLMADSAAGDERAFAGLVARHGEMVRAVALRFTNDETASEDIVQDVFWKVWQKRDSWDGGGKARFSTWLYRVTLNLCIDRLRKRKTRSWFSGPTEDADLVAALEPGPEQSTRARQELALVRADIADLPFKQKAALLLSTIAGAPNAEIALSLDVTVGAVEQAVSRARRTLREKRLAREGD
jgi:RNA polymerase sigma-70 factor, ECF subfamily